MAQISCISFPTPAARLYTKAALKPAMLNKNANFRCPSRPFCFQCGRIFCIGYARTGTIPSQNMLIKISVRVLKKYGFHLFNSNRSTVIITGGTDKTRILLAAASLIFRSSPFLFLYSCQSVVYPLYCIYCYNCISLYKEFQRQYPQL